jgi:hypothetical protein
MTLRWQARKGGASSNGYLVARIFGKSVNRPYGEEGKRDAETEGFFTD